MLDSLSPGGIEDNDGVIPRRTVSDGVLEGLRAGTAWREDGPLIGAGGSEDLQRALNAVALRKQRNRTAQRTFRERQKRRLQTAEKEVKVLQDKVRLYLCELRIWRSFPIPYYMKSV